MSTHRILLVSIARPSRTARVARRIVREVDGAMLCGIVQCPINKLSIAQRLVASGGNYALYRSLKSRFAARLLSWVKSAAHTALWIIHGCPRNITSITYRANIEEQLDEIGCPLLVTEYVDSSDVLRFANDQQPNLAIMLGSNALGERLLDIPHRGWTCVTQDVRTDGIEIRIESLRKGSEYPYVIAQFSLPSQAYDQPAGQILKADLISDDLTVKSTLELLRTNVTDAAKTMASWINGTFYPYVEQLDSATIANNFICKRYRSVWKLCLHTLLLCSPLIAGRNWHRRLRRQYPITILTHHLVSDRSHRMGISTEAFWQHVRFLQKHYRIVSLTEAVSLLNSGRVDAPTIVLTFDDGYADNFVSLRAVAEEAGIPVTLFVATQPVEYQQDFQHDVENESRGALPLTWQQISYWSSGSAVEFGSHTLTHFDCGSRDISKLESEIQDSKRDLERRLGKPVEFFAFPFGQPENISSEALRLARAEYGGVLSGFGGENYCDNTDHQHLLRKGLYADIWELELDIQSVFDLVKTIKHTVRSTWSNPSDASHLGVMPSSLRHTRNGNTMAPV